MFKDSFCFDISDNKSNVLMFYKYFMRVLNASCLLHNPNSRQFNLRTCVYSWCVQLRICSINLSHTYSVAFLNQDFKISSHLFTCLQHFKRGLHWVSDSSSLHFQGNPLKGSQFQLAVDVKQASFFNSSIFPAIYAHISICIALLVLAGPLLPANNRTEYISPPKDGFLRH